MIDLYLFIFLLNIVLFCKNKGDFMQKKMIIDGEVFYYTITKNKREKKEIDKLINLLEKVELKELIRHIKKKYAVEGVENEKSLR